jgi:hypothetical protein
MCVFAGALLTHAGPSAQGELTAENSNYALYLNREGTGSISLLDKASGYTWVSAAEPDKLENVSEDWRRFASSLAVMDFLTDTGSVRRANITEPPEYELFDAGFSAAVTFSDAGVKLKLIVTLTENGLSVEVPDDSIEYLGTNIISKLYILPFFGAAYADELQGYLFVPDGCGALVRFGPPKAYSGSYVGRIYGDDYSVSGGTSKKNLVTLPVPAQKIYLPVFGIAHGYKEAAFLAVVESGDEFCEIEASPAGNIVDFFWQAPRFVYHELYWQPTGAGSGFNAMTPRRNTVNAKVSYYFLSGSDADYVGMANKYKQSLVAGGILKKPELGADGDIPLKLDALMAEQRRTLFGSSAHPMTTTEEVEQWIVSFTSQGIRNFCVALTGWESGGVSGHKLGTFAPESKTGGESGLSKLAGTAEANGVTLALQSNYAMGYERQVPAADSVYGMSGNFTFEEVTKPLFSVKRYMNLEGILRIAQAVASQKDYKRALALDGVGSILVSDFNSARTVYREQAREGMRQILDLFAQNTSSLYLESPNLYGLPYSDAVYNAPDSHSRQVYESDAVPFYQIVLSGYKEVYSPYLNYRYNSEKDLLRLMDYNMYPAYLLTEKYSSEFTGTNIIDVYSSRRQDWEPIILETYGKLQSVLSRVRGREIVSRETVAEDVVVVGYSGGGAVVVNYSEREYNYKGAAVPALSGVYTEEAGL